MLSVLVAEIKQKKAQLDRLRPLSPRALAGLEHAYDLELTYTSNAIEGNTLTQIETALVIEHGVTIGGKKLRDHLEAIDHYDAIRYVREIADHTEPLTESDVRNLHALVMRRSDPEIAGSYASSARYVITDKGRHAFPSPTEVPASDGRLSPPGFAPRPRRRRRHSRRIAGWWIFIRSTTAMAGQRDC